MLLNFRYCSFSIYSFPLRTPSTLSSCNFISVRYTFDNVVARLRLTSERLGAAAASTTISAGYYLSFSHCLFCGATAAVAPNRQLAVRPFMSLCHSEKVGENLWAVFYSTFHNSKLLPLNMPLLITPPFRFTIDQEAEGLTIHSVPITLYLSLA